MLSAELLSELLAFRREREWEQFHNAKNLSTALSVEASELLEHFQWAKDGEIDEIVASRREEIEHEIADIAILLSYLCKDLNVSLEQVVRRKMGINAVKYPVEKARGRATKYDRL